MTAARSLARLAAAGAVSASGQAPDLYWKLTDTGVDNRFRGLSAISESTAWVAGTKGTVLRTTDGGQQWIDVSPVGAAELEFRDIEVFDDHRAVVLAIGEADASRILSTNDSGRTWNTVFVNQETAAFYNCLAFFDERHGIAMSDPVDGRIRFITTADGGASWDILAHAQSPEALDGESAFAASGQCLVAADRHHGYLVTGGAATARVVHTPDRGRSWTAFDTPVAGSASAGIYAAAFRDRHHGVLVGGDHTTPDTAVNAAAYTSAGPEAVRLADRAPGEYRSSVAFAAGPIAVTVGPTGSDLSLDGGRDWRRFDDGAFDSVDCGQGACWASGPDGRIAILSQR